jgi:hypothetical protein
LFMQHEAAQRAVERLRLQPREAAETVPQPVRRAG